MKMHSDNNVKIKKEKYLLNKNKKENVQNKIYKIVPQDIIFILQENNEKKNIQKIKIFIILKII